MTMKAKTRTRGRRASRKRPANARPDTRRDALGSSGPPEAPQAPPLSSAEPEGADLDLVDEGGMGQ